MQEEDESERKKEEMSQWRNSPRRGALCNLRARAGATRSRHTLARRAQACMRRTARSSPRCIPYSCNTHTHPVRPRQRHHAMAMAYTPVRNRNVVTGDTTRHGVRGITSKMQRTWMYPVRVPCYRLPRDGCSGLHLKERLWSQQHFVYILNRTDRISHLGFLVLFLESNQRKKKVLWVGLLMTKLLKDRQAEFPYLICKGTD